jgi:hypothetical protein
VSSPDLVLSLRGGFQLHQLDRLLHAVEPLGRLNEPAVTRLDMSGLAFITPAAFTALVALLHDRRANGLLAAGSHWVPPRSPLVERYLSRMNFHRLFTSGLAEDFIRRPPSGFRPCREIITEKDVEERAGELADAAAAALSLSNNNRVAVMLAVTELAQNVLDHAGPGVIGFAMAQSGKRRREFELAIADTGIGIHASLARNQEFANLSTDLSAIAKALESGVTSRPQANEGEGLSTVRTGIRANGGNFVIRSGTGAVESGAKEHQLSDLPYCRGTVVALRVLRDGPFDLTAVP